jgi:hypothetical protein
MDREQCLMILEGYGAGPGMIRLIHGFWHDAIMVCRAAGNYGTAFTAGHGVTQSGPLSAKLFNILVDAVVREWVQLLEENGDFKESKLVALTSTFFAIFMLMTHTLHHGMQVSSTCADPSRQLVPAGWPTNYLLQNSDHDMHAGLDLDPTSDQVIPPDAMWDGHSCQMELSQCAVLPMQERDESRLPWPPPGRCA